MTSQLQPNEYRCAACGGVFQHGRSDEEARAEAEELFGQSPDTHDMAVVCDDCFNAMDAEYDFRGTGA